jgi:hypothetical protein
MINIKNFEEFIEDNEFEGLQKECSTKHFRVIEYFGSPAKFRGKLPKDCA